MYVARSPVVKREMRRVAGFSVSGGDAVEEGVRRGRRPWHVYLGKLILEAAAKHGLRRSYKLILVTTVVGLGCMIRRVEGRVMGLASYRMSD